MKHILLIFSTLLLAFGAVAQNPPCVPDNAYAGMPPGLYPGALPDAQGCQFYDQVVTFILPRDTVASGITVNFLSFQITSITFGGMQGGMNWECNQNTNSCLYDIAPSNPNPDTMGCVRIYGTPIQFGSTGTYIITINLTIQTDLSIQPTQYTTFTDTIDVFPCQTSGSGCFTANQSSLCEPATISFTADSSVLGGTGYSYAWDFGNGLTSNIPNPPAQTYGAGQHIVSLDVTIDTFGYFIDEILLISTNCTDLVGDPDYIWTLKDPSGNTLVPFAPYVTAAPPPPTINTGISGISVTPGGNYNLEVWDEDGTFGDPNDGCATNQNSTGEDIFFPIQVGTNTYTNNGLTIQVTVSHPVITQTCSDTFTVAPLPPAPTVMVSSGDPDSLCQGDVLGLYITWNGTLQWYKDGVAIPILGLNDSINVNSSGAYTVQVTNASGCSATSQPFNVNVNAPPSVTSSVSGNCTFTVSVSPAGNFYTYQWIKSGTPIAGATSNTYTSTVAGDYSVRVTNTQTGCTTLTFMPFCQPVAIEDNAVLSAVNVYPNPTEAVLNVSMNVNQMQNMSLCLRDLMGKEVARNPLGQQVGEVSTQFDMTNWAKGIYILSIETESGTFSQKVVKE